ncbi:Monodehydroascorbate reductase 4, peroxisomal, partial [Sarracenia purpurea var. burkii]
IELVLGTSVKSADVKRKTLLTATGETISYKILIIATGARALKLEEFGLSGSDAGNVCYLRNVADATRLVEVMQSSLGGNAVVVGGGYIGMECAASLVTAVNLRDGSRLPADMVVVGIGIRPNTALFEGQLTLEKGGIKVNGQMQSSDDSVYAIGDVAAFPVKLFGETRRLEHVDSARKSARHAVAAIMELDKTGEFDYLPFFYSRVFTLSWQFYGDNAGEVVHFGDFSGHTFGAYWVSKGHLVGSFLEGGTREQYEAISKVTRLKPAIEDLAELERQGLGFVLAASLEPPPLLPLAVGGPALALDKPLYVWHATVGVMVAASIAVFAYWYGRKRRRW